jgi:hypothetical protein
MANYRVTVLGHFASGRTWSFRTHVSNSAALSVVQADWVSAVTGFWTDGAHGVETLYPTTTILDSVTTALLTPLFRESTKLSNTLALAGTSANDGMPEQDCVLVSLRGATVDKASRGRIHLPALDETLAVAGLIGSTPSTRISTAIGAMFGAMRSAGNAFFVYNVKTSAHDPVLFTPKTIVSQETDRVVRTLRVRVRKSRAQYV